MFAFVMATAIAIAPVSGPCVYDRDSMLSLDEEAFDQTINGGWRALAQKPQCERVAADLIRDYRQTHHSSAPMLFWHEGQLRADVGQTEQAVALFDNSRRKNDKSGWDLYVDGTIAFLKHDRPSLLKARQSLATLPRPSDWAPILLDGHLVELPWPENLNVLDGLLKCFDRPYQEAYGSENCTQPIMKVHVPDR
jgi:hypothetical protein